MKKFKKLLPLICLGVVSSTMSIGLLENVGSNHELSLKAEEVELPEDTFDALTTDWFTLDAYAYAPDKDGAYEGRSDLELYFSPILNDYLKISKDSIKLLLDKDVGLIKAIKYILSTQVKFIEPVEMMEVRPTTNITSDYDENRAYIFDEYVKAILSSDEIVGEDFDEAFDSFINAMKNGVDDSLIKSSGNFLRSILAYMAAKCTGANTSTDAISLLEDMLGVSEGQVTNVNTGIYNTLSSIYIKSGEGSDNLSSDILTIYNDACSIINEEKNDPIQLMEVFLILQDTEIPMDTMVEIVGQDVIKNAVIEVFTNDDIDTDVARYMLTELTTDTCYQLCECIEFTKDEVLEAIKNVDPARLMEIARGLDKQALDNIRIILGTANDNDVTPKMIKRDLPHYTWEGQYDEFGNDLVNAVLSNMSFMDLVNAVEAVWITPKDDTKSYPYSLDSQYLLYSYNYTPENEEIRDGRRLYLRNLIDFINNVLPTFEEISSRPDDKQKETFHIEVETPLTESRVYCDLTIGFQEKDCKLVRNLAKYLDDAFDLETLEFAEGENQDYSKNTLKCDLTIRPQYLNDAYSFICNSGYIFNTETNRLAEKLFSYTFATFGELKNHLASDLASEIIKDLKNIDYEVALDTLLTASKFNELFTRANISQNQITSFLSSFKSLVSKLSIISFDSIYGAVKDILGDNFAAKINSNDVKELINELSKLAIEIKENSDALSTEVLGELSNDTIYGFVDLLNGKTDSVKYYQKLLFNIVNAIPSELNDKSIMDYYLGNGEFKIDLKTSLDWKNILSALPLGNKIHTLLNAMVIEEDRLELQDSSISISSNNQLDASKVFAITYSYEDSNGVSQIRKGMLPVGATLTEYGPAEVDGKKINYWVNKTTGEKLLTMPNNDVSVKPIYVYEVNATASIEEFTYDGSTVSTLTAEATLSDYTYVYQWQFKNSSGQFVNIENATNQTYLVSKIEQSGTYRCVVTSSVGDVVISNEVTVNILVIATIDFSNTRWNYSGPLAYTNFEQTVTLDPDTLPEGEGTLYTLVYHNNAYLLDGSYVATVTVVPAEGCVVTNVPGPLSWQILPPAPDFFHRYFVSNEKDSNNEPLCLVLLDGQGVVENPTLSLVKDNEFENKLDTSVEGILGEKGVVSDAYSIAYTYQDSSYVGLDDEACTVNVLIPEEIREKENIVLLVLDKDGNLTTIKVDSSTRNGNYVSFHAEGICEFAFAYERGKSSLFSDNKTTIIFIILGISNIVMLLWWFSLTTRKEDKRIKFSTILFVFITLGIPVAVRAIKKYNNSKDDKKSE